MIPNPKLCPPDCICWKCKNQLNQLKHIYCCSLTHHNLDCPEDKLGQHCPDFTPIQVQTSGLNKY